MNCFKWVSKLNITRNTDDEYEKKIRQYEEQMTAELLNDDEGFQKKRNFNWQWLVYDIRSRLLFGILFVAFVGLGIPLIVYFADKPSPPEHMYGSCFLKPEFRVKCLVNKLTPPTEDDCIEAKCCWNGNVTLSFNCYHSLAPAYQYYVTNVQNTSSSNEIFEKVQLDLRPNLIDRMKNLKVDIEWTNLEHLNVQIYDPNKYIPSPSPSRRIINSRDANLDSPQLNFNYATLGDYFFINIKRNDSNEVIFDTRLGPLIGTEDYISFTTSLPTQYFYGLKGGLSGSEAIYDNFNRYGPTDFPFYMAYEKSGNVYGVLLETHSPFLTQYMEGPAIMFHVQSPEVSLNLHFFVGPTVKKVYEQLYSYLTANQDDQFPSSKMSMLPYWALGLHLCRTTTNEAQTLAHLQNLSTLGIPYDSDCIDENLRSPFSLDDVRYPNFTKLIPPFLQENSLKLLLSQKISLSISTTNTTSTPLIMNHDGSSPFVGYTDAENSVYYPDFLSTEIDVWLEDEFNDLMIPNELFGGLTIVENYPTTFNSSGICDSMEASTRLQNSFMSPHISERHEINICPNTLHVASSSEPEEEPKTHFEVNNVYGHESLVKLRSAFETSMESLRKERLIFTSSSIWTRSFLTGGFNGPEVPFSWDGMIESLDYLLRNFMFLPFAGTPICGSYLPDNLGTTDVNELCFRWFQLGLLLPFARNSYRIDGPKGPLDLSSAYRDRVIKNIRERYKYNPYYYTLYYQYETTENIPYPPIRPLAFDFPQTTASEQVFRTLTQFMIGPALMAAPILTRSNQREAYFPPGTWYNLAGKVQWSNENEGGIRQLDGFVSELPIYLRSGFIIPILQEPVIGRNSLGSRTGNYTLVGTLPLPSSSSDDNNNESSGIFFFDDGLEVNSTQNNHYDLLSFTLTNSSFNIETINCGEGEIETMTKIINQIKIFGFDFGLTTKPEKIEFTIVNNNETTTGQLDGNQTHYDAEYKVLYLYDLNLEWCKNFNQVNFYWDLNDEVEVEL